MGFGKESNMKRQDSEHFDLFRFVVLSRRLQANADGRSEQRSDLTSGAPLPKRADSNVAVGATPVVPAWKLLLDIVLVLIALPLVGPLMAVIAILIKIVSPGPIFFRQERVGLGGKRFQCVKFRSMRTDADPAAHQTYVRRLQCTGAAMEKMDAHKDRRLIRWGGLLRATALDELPQLWNVVRGEMSWVGPRPCIPYELEKYEPWHYQRFNSLPGLTGWWQVKGKNRTTFDEMVRLDIEYTQRQSLLLDFYILLRTPLVVIQQVVDCLRGGQKVKEAHLMEEAVVKEDNPCTASDTSVQPCITPDSYEANS